MSALGISLVVLVTVLAGAFAGSQIGARLPPQHLSDASKDVVKVGVGFLATLAALVLGLLVASAKSSYDAKSDEVERSVARIILLDRNLRQYGPEADAARKTLRLTLESRESMTWVKREVQGPAASSATAGASNLGGDAIRAAIAALVPASDAQRSIQSRSLQMLDDYMQTRWLLIAQSSEGVSVPLLTVLVAWITTIAFCTGLDAPRNATVAGVTLLCTVSVAGAIFLILEMYDPFEGFLKISDAPLRTAVRYLQ